ncbi:hypothetical protein ULMS_01230 [Patiriisocius marinistellae]|uniref:Uncharacterized protein n=1 Tax=Patiriisocius marinistellae TaxID=2494560 RepID=A0A5J4FX55_9FLAO|nr:hypothetical protein [Patiriisocius marinistellae]GEQ84615.1 hypothetical protein ULMS_01230 [Patiriisocius marinistellae]
MKIIFSILIMLILNSSFISCTPQAIENNIDPQETVGEDSNDNEDETDE